jgi:branched-chain amino acid transport system permease protein
MDFSVLVNEFPTLTVDGIALGFIYVLIALGYTMVYGVLRLINFANSEVFMIGTFASILVVTNVFNYTIEIEPLTGTKLVITMLAMLIGAMIVSGVVSVLVEIVAYRRLRAITTNRLTSLISAIGVSIFLAEGVRLLTDSAPMVTPRILDKVTLVTILGADIRVDILLVVIFALILLLCLDIFVNKTRLGKGIRAVSMDYDTAKLMGININKVVSTTFLVGGLGTGAAAFFYVTVYEVTVFNVGFELGIAAFTAAVLGGIGNIRGAFAGGLALGLIEMYSSSIFGTQWKTITAFVILVLVLLFRPNGIFGESLQQARV